ncbi:MAG: GntR family transcriptional regulator [Defluviitaleaceae bacterium]|nr:GntR family transcriptional regulator [Defluviitaleaceae bacterium]
MLDLFVKPTPGNEPVYLQIIKQFKLLVLQRHFKDGDEIPSRRMLAVQMGVNPMTVQKAFAELETGGLVQTPPNAKSVAFVDEAKLNTIRRELLEGQIDALVETAVGVGVGEADLMKMVKAIFERKDGVK